ncbi:MAG: hypothetical protein J6Y53_01690 [Alphaproteobacteria bacterium]|nr:hypothetical protein [Alphaproteobacteria bacterium]
MLKKIGRFIRFCFIFVAWTGIYMSVISLLFAKAWNFYLFKKKSWQIILNFWNQGGVINSTQEILFFICLLLIIPLWFLGLRKALKISIAKIIFFPIFLYNAYQEKKYSQAPKSIILKNMGMTLGKKSAKQNLEEMIASRMPKETDKKDLNSNKIRSSLEKKSLDFHKKNTE